METIKFKFISERPVGWLAAKTLKLYVPVVTISRDRPLMHTYGGLLYYCPSLGTFRVPPPNSTKHLYVKAKERFIEVVKQILVPSK